MGDGISDHSREWRANRNHYLRIRRMSVYFHSSISLRNECALFDSEPPTGRLFERKFFVRISGFRMFIHKAQYTVMTRL